MLPKRLQSWIAIQLLAFALLAFTVVYPILFIFKASFVDAETGLFSLKSYAAIFHYPFYLRCLKNSLFVSTLATLFHFSWASRLLSSCPATGSPGKAS